MGETGVKLLNTLNLKSNQKIFIVRSLNSRLLASYYGWWQGDTNRFADLTEFEVYLDS